jgi:hypothetical protein
MNSRAPGLVARRRLQVLPLNLFVVQEDVVEGAVDDRVEPILEPVESCCIRDPEVDRRAGTLRVAFGPINRRPGAVNARCHIALRREVDRVMARTRSRVEDFSKHHRPQLSDHRLRFADVPRRWGVFFTKPPAFVAEALRIRRARHRGRAPHWQAHQGGPRGDEVASLGITAIAGVPLS